MRIRYNIHVYCIEYNFSFLYSQYSIHNTRLRTANDGTPECVVRASDQQIRPITTLGNEDLKLLYSPGFPEGVP